MTIQFDLAMSDYLAMDALSSGVAHRVINQSPLHALNSKTFRKPSAQSNIGELCHRLLLEGHEENIVLIDAENFLTKAAKTERDQAYKDGKVPILARDMAPIRTMVAMAKHFVEQTEIAGIFESGRPEVTVTWDEDGLLCKARPDWLSDEWHLSVKTTNVLAGANPASFSRKTLTPQGYDFNLEFYRRGLEKNGINVQHRILVIEQNKPHGCCLIALEPNKAAIAAADVERAIGIWRECEKTNTFPAYPTETFWAEALPWEMAEAEEREYERLTAVGVAA